jgi:phage shock protein E
VRRTAVAAALAVVVGAAGCAQATAEDTTSADPTAIVAPVEVAAMTDERTFIDVRTPDEVADGHVTGSLLLDVTDPGFDEAVAELDRDEPYVVYCRSGNRSGQAIERMLELGFTDLINGGAYDDLADQGLDVTT